MLEYDMSNPVISVMIAVHNAASSIRAALESLDNALNENGSPERVEAIIINDGSTDKSLDIINHYQPRNFIKVVETVNFSNIGKVRHYAYSLSRGEYITALDSDDMLKNGALTRVMDIMREHPFDLLITRLDEHHDRHPVLEIEDKPVVSITQDRLKELYLEHKMVKGHLLGRFIRRDILTDDMFPEIYCYEDVVITAYVICAAQNILITDTQIYCYYKHRGSLSTEKSMHKTVLFLQIVLSMENFFVKNKNEKVMFEGLFVKVCSDYLSRNNKRKLPRFVMDRFNDIKTFHFLFSTKVRLSRKMMFLKIKSAGVF
ncbi:TPA: glycosyltransferase family 2 protein [Morganella morganii]|nr:glycosyltransferase family 2 protein [Morganella morganii]MCU6226765.1 glycosyltransferase family 2 protein [Morganella morganii]MCU6233900.1 glycosyltransferase family 2 protein [Morganella morganii]MCU6236917.1 glycosyltransferase family 2 protein [Morganella morganii]MCU6274633.1 glycosyltransferase family 2 protein [Morganella morganii]